MLYLAVLSTNFNHLEFRKTPSFEVFDPCLRKFIVKEALLEIYCISDISDISKKKSAL